MNPLLKRLASLRRKVRWYDGWIGIAALAALVLGVGVAEGLLDFWLHIPSLFRAALLVGLLVSAGFFVYRLLIRPFAAPYDDLSLALRVEEAYPELNDSLASTVQFLTHTPEDQARLGGSEAMRERTVRDAVQNADQCDFGRVLAEKRQVVFPPIVPALYALVGILFRPKQAVELWCALWSKSKATFAGALMYGVLIAATAIVSMNVYRNPYVGIAFWRFVEPFGMHTWTQVTVERQNADMNFVLLDPHDQRKDRIAEKRPYFIKVNLQGQMPPKKEAKVEIVGQSRSDKMVPLNFSDDGRSAWFTTGINMTEQSQKFKFKVMANDGTFPPRAGTWHEVEVVPPPRLTAPPQITIYPPAYTGLKSPEVLEAGTSLVKVYAGSTVVLRACANRPLDKAWIEYQPQQPGLIEAAKLACFRQTEPLHAVGSLLAGATVWDRIPAEFDADGASFRITFTPVVTGKFVLHLREDERLESELSTDLDVVLDPIPEVKLLSPRSSMNVLPTADINFKFLAQDEQFAIRSVYVEYRRKTAGAEAFDSPERTVLYDAAVFGKLLPSLSARMARSPVAGAHPLMGKTPLQIPNLKLRHQKLDVDMVWSLRNEFKVGDLVVVEVCADDFCDIYPTREPGRSHAVELRIISKRDMIDIAEKTLTDIHKDLQKVVKVEEKARDTVKETQKLDKSDQKVVDNFNENAEAPQRDVQDRVGKTSDEGIRRDVKEIRKMLEQNKLTGTQAYRDATKIQGALDSIAKKELQEIDPKLLQAREELTKNENITPKTQKNLGDAAKLQDRVVKSLNELIQELNPEAKMNELRDEMRKLSQKEKDLLQRSEDLNEQKQANDKNPDLTKQQKDDFKNDQEKEIKKLQKEQTELAAQMEKLVQKMKDAKQDFEKHGDERNAKKISDALKEAGVEQQKDKPMPMPLDKKEPISGEMNKIADELKKKDEVQNQTLDKQKNVVKQMENVLDALEGKNDDGIKQAMQERKDAEKKVDDINKKLDKLREQTKKAEMIEDKEERLKKKEELAKQHEQLQEEIEKTRRELARLNEQRAANDLADAAKNVEKAGNDLQQGNNPDDAQKKAQQDLKNAKNDLKEAQEELAREMLVKMADQLDGLKKRQVASLERSDALHTKIMDKKSWSDAFLDTIDGNIDAQKDIGAETDTLKDKLKEAKVFHSVLDKAKKSMDDAGEVMKIRREEGKDRRRIEMGEKLDAMELKDETGWHNDTVKHQMAAVKRLDILLDSIKEEIEKMDRKKKEREENPNGDNPPDEPPQGGMRAQDGIPPNAQLKALRALQLDLNERTADFAKRVPDPAKANEDQKKELQELSDEQAAIHQLFQQILPAQQPELKEGAPQ